jgi:glutathione synthase
MLVLVNLSISNKLQKRNIAQSIFHFGSVSIAFIALQILTTSLLVVSASPTLFQLPPQSKTFVGTSTSTRNKQSISTSTGIFSSSADSPSTSVTMQTIPTEQLTGFANAFAAANGLQIETRQSASSSYQCAPISLLPNVFPAQSFNEAKSLAPHFNLLVDKISRDGKFLNDTLAGGEVSVISKDGYTAKLLKLYNEIYVDDGKETQSAKKPNFAKGADRLGIQRSDYMLNPTSSGNSFELKQVELNTIAASFAGLATNVAKLHSILTNRFEQELKDWIQMNTQKVMGSDYIPDPNAGVPTNPALEKLAFAMKVAHERYLSRFVNCDNGDNATSDQPPVAILFVIQEGETNTVDQRKLELQLWEDHRIPVVRMSLTAAHKQLHLDSETGSLYIMGESQDSIRYQVSMAYYRAGYAPTDYPDGDNGIEWEAREVIERSKATKCPSLGYHLAGTKKVQQELARPGVLEYFIDNKDVIASMRDSFAGLYSLGDDAVKEDFDAVTDAISGNDANYVLKPQREGGGYNFYGSDLAAKINENIKKQDDGSLLLGDDLAEYILMQRLFPPKQTGEALKFTLSNNYPKLNLNIFVSLYNK